ncbi:MAG: hypothetical protein J3K34DRAFT_223443 [Monoraphidium minutum]|nr:MAG: hypothetical protein J3K34DRAFT_223443 [Monoraphidium minutum]
MPGHAARCQGARQAARNREQLRRSGHRPTFARFCPPRRLSHIVTLIACAMGVCVTLTLAWRRSQQGAASDPSAPRGGVSKSETGRRHAVGGVRSPAPSPALGHAPAGRPDIPGFRDVFLSRVLEGWEVDQTGIRAASSPWIPNKRPKYRSEIIHDIDSKLIRAYSTHPTHNFPRSDWALGLKRSYASCGTHRRRRSHDYGARGGGQPRQGAHP